MDKASIRRVIVDQRSSFQDMKGIVHRPVPDILVGSNAIGVITGVRRSGKSTLLRQIGAGMDHVGFLNFEDDRLLGLDTEDLGSLLEVFLEMDPSVNTFFFDEIQAVTGWERFVRRLFDRGAKVFVTGSNATLLGSEIATTLTGRNIPHVLYPFSFGEFVDHAGLARGPDLDTSQRSRLVASFNEYMEHGGFPEVVVDGHVGRLSHLYRDILIKDLLVHFGIRNQHQFRALAMFLVSNTSRSHTYRSIAKAVDIQSVTTVQNHVHAMEEAYLIHTVNAFHRSYKRQLIMEKKVFAIDPGLVRTVSFRTGPDTGHILETTVFLEALRRGYEVFYHKGDHECDLILRRKERTLIAIQVSASISSPPTREREIRGLLEAMDAHGLGTGVIVTMDTEESIYEGNRTIKVVPAWQFLLEREWSVDA